jgi:hypothetical protein
MHTFAPNLQHFFLDALRFRLGDGDGERDPDFLPRFPFLLQACSLLPAELHAGDTASKMFITALRSTDGGLYVHEKSTNG